MLLYLTMTAALAAGSVKDLDKQDGFRGVYFGTPCAEAEMSGAPDTGTARLRRRNERLEVGRATLTSVVWTCHDGLVYAVSVTSMGANNRALLLDALTEAYGPATQTIAGLPVPDPLPKKGVVPTGHPAAMYWVGKTVTLTWTDDPFDDMVTATWTSVDEVALRRDQVEAARVSAVDDLLDSPREADESLDDDAD